MNLLETGGVTERNQANGQSVLEFARSKKLGVLINRALNAIAHNKILRLAEVGATRRVSDKDVTDLIDRLISSEKMLKDKILSRLGLPPAPRNLRLWSSLPPGRSLNGVGKTSVPVSAGRSFKSAIFSPGLKECFSF